MYNKTFKSNHLLILFACFNKEILQLKGRIDHDKCIYYGVDTIKVYIRIFRECQQEEYMNLEVLELLTLNF